MTVLFLHASFFLRAFCPICDTFSYLFARSFWIFPIYISIYVNLLYQFIIKEMIICINSKCNLILTFINIMILRIKKYNFSIFFNKKGHAWVTFFLKFLKKEKIHWKISYHETTHLYIYISILLLSNWATNATYQNKTY